VERFFAVAAVIAAIVTFGGMPGVVAALVFIGIGMGGAVIIVARNSAFLGLGLGIGIFGALDGTMGRFVVAATLMRTRRLAATLLMAVVKLSPATTAATPATTTAASATATMPSVGVVPTLGRTVATALRTGLLALLTGGRIALLLRPRGGFGLVIFVFVLVVEIIHARRRRIGGARRTGCGDGLGLAGEMLTRGQLDIARGEAGEFGRTHDARRLGRGGGADDDLGNDVARAGAEEVFEGVGHQLGVDGALRVERHGGLGRRLGIGPGVNGGGADAVTAQFVEKGLGEMMKAAFDSCGNGAARSEAVAIPAQNDKVPLLLAEPRQGDAGECEGRQEADVEALGQGGDRGVEQRSRFAPGGVNDEAYMPFAGDDVLGHLGEGGGVSKVAREGKKIVVRERIAGELGGECIHPAAHADQAPGDSEPRPGVGAGD
jgi:hypothetical protein